MSCLCVFFKQKTAYEMRISDWSSDVCSSDLCARGRRGRSHRPGAGEGFVSLDRCDSRGCEAIRRRSGPSRLRIFVRARRVCAGGAGRGTDLHWRSEEHTSELQSLMRISYAVFCLKKKKRTTRMRSCPE